MSIVKIVELELNIELNDDISAASMTAIMTPRRPSGMMPSTRAGKAVLLQDTGLPQTAWQRTDSAAVLPHPVPFWPLMAPLANEKKDTSFTHVAMT